MFSEMYLNTCVRLWTFLAQATPAATDVPAAVPAATSTIANPPMAMPTGAALPGMPGLQTTPAEVASQVVSQSLVYTIFNNILLAVYFLVCVALIVCVMFQTTKSEGLSGVIGGSATSSLFRGKKSAEESLGLWTTRLAVAFVVISLGLWLMGRVK